MNACPVFTRCKLKRSQRRISLQVFCPAMLTKRIIVTRSGENIIIPLSNLIVILFGIVQVIKIILVSCKHL